MKRIYLDHAAATPLDAEVQRHMEAMLTYYGNPSSLYQEALTAKEVLAYSRSMVAEALNTTSETITFTGSGTESDNLALLGVARAYQHKGKHIITTRIEHPAVLRSVEALARWGFEIEYLPVDADGLVNPQDLEAMIRDDTTLVSVMYVNNEVGTVEPVAELARIARSHGVLFHTDAAQAGNYLTLDVEALGVDLLSFSASKLYGPKGIGVLYVRKGVMLEPVIYGGGQEQVLRSGTENVMLSRGLAVALALAQERREEEVNRMISLREYFIEELHLHIPNLMINGSRTQRIPNNVHVSIEGIEGEAMVLLLDQQGIAAATGSSCSSLDLEVSHVLKELGINDELAHGSLRFTLGRDTNKEDLDYTTKQLASIVEHLRSFSALNSNNA